MNDVQGFACATAQFIGPIGLLELLRWFLVKDQCTALL